MLGTGLTMAMLIGVLPVESLAQCDQARLTAPQCWVTSGDLATATIRSTANDQAAALDPRQVFDEVVSRYRSLSRYEDTVVVEHVTTRAGEAPRKHETRLQCTYDDAGSFTVTTPGDQVREAVGLGGVIRRSPLLRDLDRQYGLWLAPHLALRFSDDPLRDLRAGVTEGFTPVKAERVVENERELVRVELRAGSSEGDAAGSTVEFFVNPDSLLIVRMQGRQHLPDGVLHETRLEITPLRYEVGPGAA